MNRLFSMALMALLISGPLGGVASAVTLRASEATVSGAGETATICVHLQTEGEEVAGTQNELVWDPSCATLTGLNSCEVSPGHGKDLHSSFPNGDGLPPLRAFVFSMSDTDPMPDGELYCCDFTSELTGPGSCPVSVQAARASTGGTDAKGLAASGVAGGIFFRGSGGTGGGGGGRSGGVVSGGVTGGGATGGAATGGGTGGTGGQAGGGVAGGAGGVTTGLGQPPSQVLPGGVPGEEPVDTDAVAQAARDAAQAEAERIMQAQRPDEEELVEEEVDVGEPLVEPEPTEEPTAAAAAPTSPAPKPTEIRGTPTAKAPTVGRTPAAAAAAAQAPKEESRGWFGCQVTANGGGGLSIFFLVGLVGIIANRLRRKSSR